MQNIHPQVKIFLAWVGANLLGFLIMGLLVLLISQLDFLKGSVNPLLLVGVPVSLAQWLVLRRLVSMSVLWILSIPVGWIIAGLLPAIIPQSLWEVVDDESTAVLTILFLVMGGMMGLVQWLLLWRKLPKSGLWILGSSLGVGLGFGLVLATGWMNTSEYLSYILVVLVYALTTGLVLGWLLNLKTQMPVTQAAASG